MSTVTTPPRTYPEARLVDVVDGDTVKLVVSGLDVDVHLVGRLRGINAAEHGTPDGDAATVWVKGFVGQLPAPCSVTTRKTRDGSDQREKYGRYLVDVVVSGGDLATALVAAGHAVPWDGKGKRPVA